MVVVFVQASNGKQFLRTPHLTVDSIELIWQDWERAAVENRLGAAIVGSNATVKGGLEKLVADTGANEVIVVTDTYEHIDRLESYRRVADVAITIGMKATVAAKA